MKQRTNLSKVIKNELENAYGGKIKIYDTEIPFAIKTAEASLKGQSVSLDTNSSCIFIEICVTINAIYIEIER